ncbi:hypothetical protein AX14_012866 [Amanita brunnescens Koide BX004]|nr:hypothetical protein AX14_012866 [Amanita brunnescens Koide BX004]
MFGLEQPRHSKRSFAKWPKPADSPAYDASEEDNDPLTDDGSAVSVPVSRLNAANNTRSLNKATRVKQHQLAANLLSDSDGVDSPTYDGDIESSTTAGADGHQIKTHRASSASTLSPSATPSPVITPSKETPDPLPATRAVDPESQHLVFISQPESPVSPLSSTVNPALFTPEDIQAFVKKAVTGDPARSYKINPPPVGRPVRIYADGVYDLFHFGHALQLRQAKLSFPSVYLLVGVNSDELVKEHKSHTVMSHQERLEAVQHCRWVDEVVPDAPWVIDDNFIQKYQIDYVAHDEVPYAGAGQADVYYSVKEQGRFLPTRRTPGVSTSELLERIVSGYRKRDFDSKLVKMGRSELRAEGSDFDDLSLSSRNASRFASRSESPAHNT